MPESAYLRLSEEFCRVNPDANYVLNSPHGVLHLTARDPVAVDASRNPLAFTVDFVRRAKLHKEEFLVRDGDGAVKRSVPKFSIAPKPFAAPAGPAPAPEDVFNAAGDGEEIEESVFNAQGEDDAPAAGGDAAQAAAQAAPKAPAKKGQRPAKGDVADPGALPG